MSMMEQMPQILGNADPVHYLQLLPSVQTNGEFDAGLHVHGCSNGQSIMQIGDAPIYNPAHMLGFFSTFNASHYSSLLFRTFNEADAPNYLGGSLQMMPHVQPQDTLSGNLSVGLISSQGTLHVPLGRKQSLSVSARQTYINLLYGSFIHFDDSEYKYRFGDFNVTYSLRFPRHTFSVDAFYSSDNGKIGDEGLDMGLDMRWRNYLVSAQLNSHPACLADTLHQSLYLSGYSNRARITQTQFRGTLPSGIKTLGYHAEASRLVEGLRLPLRVSYGINLLYHDILPQNPDVDAGHHVDSSDVCSQYAAQTALFAQASLPLTERIAMKVGLRLNAYALLGDSAALMVHPDPYLAFTYVHPRAGQFHLRLNRQHQYIHQAGFSSVGFPTEFRFSSSRDFAPQSSLCLTFGYDRELLDRRYRLKLELYGKSLAHQLDYHGDLISLYTSGFDMQGTIVSGKGYNYGFNLQLIKQTGKFTGWVSYAYGRSLRRFPALSPEQWYPSNYERPHELNAVATYRICKRLSCAGTLVFASGTPFTSIKYVYILSSVLVSQYGEHNANRLSPYFRVDLSANYELKPRRSYSHGLNFSLYNATASKNDIFCQLNISHGKYSYHPISFMLSVLPSFSYYIHF